MATIKVTNQVYTFANDGDVTAETDGVKNIVAVVISTTAVDSNFRIRRKDGSGAILWSTSTPSVIGAPLPGFPVNFTTAGGLYVDMDGSATIHAYCGSGR